MQYAIYNTKYIHKMYNVQFLSGPGKWFPTLLHYPVLFCIISSTTNKDSTWFQIPMLHCMCRIYHLNFEISWRMWNCAKIELESKFVVLKGFEADLICSRLKLSKCAIAIPQAAHLLLNLLHFVNPLQPKLSLTKIPGTFVNVGGESQQAEGEIKSYKICFFSPDIGSHYSFPTVSAKRPSGSGFIGTR